MLRPMTKAGWTSTMQPWSRSHRKRRNIRSSLHWSQEKCGVGVPPNLALKPSGLGSRSCGRLLQSQWHLPVDPALHGRRNAPVRSPASCVRANCTRRSRGRSARNCRCLSGLYLLKAWDVQLPLPARFQTSCPECHWLRREQLPFRARRRACRNRTSSPAFGGRHDRHVLPRQRR
jgi:hypothetical protein